MKRVLVIGAGVCGLAAAVELTRLRIPFVLCEQSDRAGGLSPTVQFQGHRLELGPHIYFDRDPDVVAYWKSLIGDVLREYQRSTKLFYSGRYIASPLSIVDTFAKLGPLTTAKVLFSYASARLRTMPVNNAEDWVVANFGRELFERFFRVYNEKIWGLPSSQMAPDWAGQRIRMSLVEMVVRSIRRDPTFIVKTFAFPDGGSQVLHAAQLDIINSNPDAEIRYGCKPMRIAYRGGTFLAGFAGEPAPEVFSHVIATNHLDDLVELLEYEGKSLGLSDLCSQLRYRNVVHVNLIYRKSDFRDRGDHWIDIHDPSVRALRVTNYSNYEFDGPAETVAVGAEYNCSDDGLWASSDAELIDQALADLSVMGLATRRPLAASVVRAARAYPVYFLGYREILARIIGELTSLDGLILAGRNAMYKWNNMHHSAKTGIYAARNVAGEDNDLWSVRGNVTIGKDSD